MSRAEEGESGSDLGNLVLGSELSSTYRQQESLKQNIQGYSLLSVQVRKSSYSSRFVRVCLCVGVCFTLRSSQGSCGKILLQYLNIQPWPCSPSLWHSQSDGSGGFHYAHLFPQEGRVGGMNREPCLPWVTHSDLSWSEQFALSPWCAVVLGSSFIIILRVFYPLPRIGSPQAISCVYLFPV